MANRTQKPGACSVTSGRKPSTYEVTAARFHYHFRREPAPTRTTSRSSMIAKPTSTCSSTHTRRQAR